MPRSTLNKGSLIYSAVKLATFACPIAPNTYALSSVSLSPFVDDGQIFLYETQDRLEESLTRVGVFRHK